MKHLDHPAVDTMVAAVRAACRICRGVQIGIAQGDSVTKDDKSPVTIADFASQAVVSRALAAEFPDIPLVGEETADLLREEANAAVRDAVVARTREEWPDAKPDEVLALIDRGDAEPAGLDRFFTLDPIDGTKGFLRGEQYAVALALVEDGDADAEPAEVSDVNATSGVRFTESVEKAHSNKGRSAEIAKLLGVAVPPVPIDSQVKYAVVARGEAELYLRIPRGDYVEKIWDHAAGSLVVTEAGGTVTDIEGRALDFSRGRTLAMNRGIVASNGKVHDAVLEALAATEK